MSSIRKNISKSLFLAGMTFTILFSFYSQVEGEVGAVSIPVAVSAESTAADIPQEGKYDVMLDSVSGPLTYYNQADARWGSFLYGGRDPMSTYGCGPTVMAMLITSLTGKQVLPSNVAIWAAANNCWCPGQGSYHRLIADSASAYGLNASPIKDYTVQGIQNALNSGHLIVALVKKGHFTNQGHFIIITRMTQEGKLRIADSNNYNNTKIDWDPVLIIKELNYRSSNGGPLWMIGLPESVQ